jgi:hypothetical protein
LTVPAGGQQTDLITIAPLNGSFSSAIQLSCVVTGSTPLATCSFSSNSVTPGANSVTSTLTISAPKQSAGLIPPEHGQRARALYAAFLPFPVITLIWLCLARGTSRTRRRQILLLYSLFVVFVALQAGCGGGSGGQQTQPQNYTVTITATSGAIQHTAQVTLMVP